MSFHVQLSDSKRSGHNGLIELGHNGLKSMKQKDTNIYIYIYICMLIHAYAYIRYTFFLCMDMQLLAQRINLHLNFLK